MEGILSQLLNFKFSTKIPNKPDKQKRYVLEHRHFGIQMKSLKCFWFGPDFCSNHCRLVEKLPSENGSDLKSYKNIP